MKSLLDEGKSLGKKRSKEAQEFSKQISADDLLPLDQKGKKFDSETAKRQIKTGSSPDSEVLDLVLSDEVFRNIKENKNFHKDELFLKRSEEIAKYAKDNEEIEEEEHLEYTFHQCKEFGDPFLVTLTRELFLQVSANHQTCQGHEEKISHPSQGDAAKTLQKYKTKLSKDPTIQWFDVQITGGGMRASYIVVAKWKHYDGVTICDHCQGLAQVTQEQWIYDDPNLILLTQGPDCTLIEQVCLDPNTTKTINGLLVTRKCWKERMTFFYQFPQMKDCLFLKNNSCEQIEQNCLQPTSFGCALWEKTFKCFSKIKKIKSSKGDVFGFDGSHWETDYEPNRSFADVAIKLSIFEEAEKDLKQANAFDATKLTIFKGEKFQCSKNVAADLMYDCCFSYSGLAKQFGLSKCTADEISLAERREKGLCHYVGSYEEKMLDMWKSRDEHVFCCFSTKLARVLQEEGRQQLHKGWGESKHPDCGGFTIDELTKLNFSKMNLSEVFDKLPRKLPDGFDQKIEAFQDRIREQIDSEKKERDED